VEYQCGDGKKIKDDEEWLRRPVSKMSPLIRTEPTGQRAIHSAAALEYFPA
jgi:hypothetical protein